MKQLIILSLVLSLPAFLSAQKKNTGFYGKTAFVEFNTSLSYPLFPNLKQDMSSRFYHADRIAAGWNLVLGKALAPKVALSLETGVFYGNFSANSDGSYEDYYYDSNPNSKYKYVSFEKLAFKTFTIMPKLEFSGKGGTSPGGLSHQIGIGYTSSRMSDKNYEYRLKPGYSVNPSTEIANYDRKYKGFTILYAVNLRVPISKSLLFNYGLRTTLNITSKGFGTTNENLFINDREANESIRVTRLRSLLNLQFGFTYLIF